MKIIYLAKITFCLIFFTISFSVPAQSLFENYKPIQSTGKLPDDLLILSSEKFEQEKATLSTNEKKFDRKAKKQFMLENSFRMRELLYKGKILFNDPVGLYVNKVADQLLVNNPQLRKEVRIYVVKSPAVNAFATNSGMIFINLGLLAQLESEAQLAFVLAHELTHYTKKHVINQYVVDQRIDNNKKGYQSLSAEEKLLTSNNYSKELETEADIAGLELYLNSNYSTSQLNGVFNVLQYSYLPFDDVSFDKSFFETEHLILPQEYFLMRTKAISSTEQYDEQKSTHPSLKKRREYILQHIEGKNENGKKEYLISEAEFAQARKIARYELSAMYLSNVSYEKAIYNSYLLLREDKNNQFLKKNIAKALYGLTKYVNEDAYRKVHEKYDSIEGYSQQVFHLFDKLKPKELNVLAINYIWRLKKQFPADKELSNLADDILKSFVLKHCDSKDEFNSIVPESSLQASVEKVDSAEYNKFSKFEKVEFNQRKEKRATDQYFIKNAFIDHFKDKAFSEAFDKYIKEKQLLAEKSNETKKQKRVRERNEKALIAKEAKINRKKGYALGIDKVVIVNPFYVKLDERKRNFVKYIASEEAQLSLDQKINANAKYADLNIELLSQNSFTASDVEKFNDYAFLRTWISERINHLEAEVPMSNLEGERVEQLIQKYGTKYYCWTGILDLREKKTNVGLTLFYTAVLYPLLPFGIYYAVTPAYDTYYYTLVFNLETGKPEFGNIQHINKKARPDVLNSAIYDTFYQFKIRR